jgi:hypothetical protein
MDRMVSAQPLGNERDLLRREKFADELCISFSNGKHPYPLKHIGSAKRLGNESSSISTELHQLINQQFHRMGSGTWTSVARLAVGQQDMIHAAGAQHWIIEADGNAGTKQRAEDSGRSTRRNIADIKAYAIFV